MSSAGETSGRRQNGPQAAGAYPRNGLDFYIEPQWAVDLLLDAEPIECPAWDPACGCGTIPMAFALRCKICFGTDKADRLFGGIYDFLGDAPPPHRPRSIITNPPYNAAEAFVRRALDLAPVVAVLVQAKFLYSQRRHSLFTDRPPARIYHLSTRPSMPPGEMLLAGTIEAGGGKLDFAWVVWDERRHSGVTETRWLRRPAP